ncbi:hypothetical protein NE237_008409 [Protea cynaroides]|uniref:Cupin type-1 domain-containing protein n=1 Tax=Protea cynaroides TaxID=273540 RepID=A0A9Q0KVY9_9MAGN|nr:hypothetical protein NE237_008409 [Protea cynaroides]
MARIKPRATLLLLLLVMFFLSVPMTMGYDGEEEEEEEGEEEEEERGHGGRGGRGERGYSEDKFLLQHKKKIVKTEAGEMKVVRGFREKNMEIPMHIGFINMEPKTLFIPQYLDSSLILFVRRGEVKIGWIYKDGLVEKQLNMGDVYRIPAGSPFYMLNTGEGQRLQIICSIDKSESIGPGPLKKFLIAGGTYPTPVFAGFDRRILRTAFNVTSRELDDILTRQDEGPIIYVPDAHQPGKWASFMQLKQRERLDGLMGREEEEDEEDDGEEELVQEKQEKQEEEQGTWTWRKLMESVMRKQQNKESKRERERERESTRRSRDSPDPYNLYDTEPDFRNSYGWSLAVDKHDYPPLKHSKIGVYLVNLTAGSMMAPHVNPRATEYGIVLSGGGTVQVVYPNGSSAMNTEVREGDVFVVPRYFPFCQIASRGAPMEFFGFTTSARKNRPLFLVGANSILQTMKGPEVATAFGMSLERFEKLVDAQYESVILPTVPAEPPEEESPEEEEEGEEEEKKKKKKLDKES